MFINIATNSTHFVGSKNFAMLENMDWYVTSKFTYVWNLKRLLQIFNELNGIEKYFEYMESFVLN